MDPLKFLEIEDPRKHQAEFSRLSGQKASLMPKMTPGKKSVGAAAVQGAVGGALAGGQMAASAGMFNAGAGPESAGTEAYGDRTAPTMEAGPTSPQGKGTGLTPFEEDYDKRFGGKSSGDLFSMFLA